MKKLFSTPRRAVISVICMVVVVATVSVIAVKSTLISRAEAKAVALKDAGLSESEASALRVRLAFDDGRFQYEIDFYNNGTEYEYSIQAKDGDIIARDIEGERNTNHSEQDLLLNEEEPSAADENHSGQLQEEAENPPEAEENRSEQPQEEAGNPPETEGNRSEQPQEEAGSQPAPATEGNRSGQPREETGNQPAADGNSTAQPQVNSVDGAKSAALRDAGLSESDVTFKKTELDHENGIKVYEIEFYTSDTEYEYKINASDYTVVEKSTELFQSRKTPAESSAGSSGNNYIGVDRAKETALNHAGLNESDVRFSKAKLENDDGRVEYEIEFYYGRTEYEYTIDAVSGNVIEYDIDYDD